MRATMIEYRLRLLIIAILLGIGYWAPWIDAAQTGARISLLEWLALQLSRAGILPFASATPVVIVLASVFAAIGALLRIWGTAWIGTATMNSLEMQAQPVVADGPYRYVRNPLYLGTWFTIAALSFIMPASGAAVSVVLISIFLLRLVLAEERFLASRLGDSYAHYLRAVPRLFPRLRTSLPSTGGTPRWGRAVLAETNPLGIFIIFATLSWRYNNSLMLRAILINFGVSLVIRAFIPSAKDNITALP